MNAHLLFLSHIIYIILYGLQNYIFVKETIPEDGEGKIELSAKLQKYKVSLREYRDAMEENELQ